MGKERVEAQTDGGLFIDVPDPLAQTTFGKRIVWTRSYYVLPLEVLSVLLFCLLACSFIPRMQLIVGQTQDSPDRERRLHKGS
jgi:hypothetical protein